MTKKHAGHEDLTELRGRMKRLDDAFERLWRSYYSRETPADKKPTYDALRTAAQDFVKANHAYQSAKYGRVMVRLSVSKLMR